MAIPKDVESLRREVGYAERVRQQHLASRKKIIQGFTTPFWRSESGQEYPEDSVYLPENHNYKILRYMTPKLAYQRPRVSMTSRMVGMDDELREREVVLDQWMQDHRVERLGQQAVPDFMSSTFCSHVSVVPHKYLGLDGMMDSPEDEPAVDVIWERLSPLDFGFDPSARTREAREYEFHSWVTDKRSLMERAEREEGWNVDAIRALPESEERAEGVESEHRRKGQPDRKEVTVYQMWFRHDKIDETKLSSKGYNGVIYTFAIATSNDEVVASEFVREPQDFFGPSTGPYVGGEVYYVPDSSFGLAPMVAHEGQNRDLNRHAKGVSDMAARYKRLILCASAEMAEEIESKPNDYIITIPGLEANAVIEIEVGGVTDQVLGYLQLAHGRLESVSGLSEALQGSVSGRGTATEQQIASIASDVATDFVKGRFQDIFAEGLAKVDWYINMHPKYRAAISPEAVEDGVQEEFKEAFQDGYLMVFKGGSPEIPPELLSLEIEPMSMERVSEALLQKRTLELTSSLTQLLPLQQQFPDKDWGMIYDMLGQAMNIPGLGDAFAGGKDGKMAQPQIAQPTLSAMSGRIQPQGIGTPGQDMGAVVNAARQTA